MIEMNTHGDLAGTGFRRMDRLIHKILEAVTTVEPVDGLLGLVEYYPKRGSGLTIDVLSGHEAMHGYAVSLAGFEVNVSANVLSLSLQQYIRKYMPLLEEHWLGLWEHDGRIYMDVTIVVDTFDEALAEARRNQQLAFFHLDTGTEHVTADYSALVGKHT